MDQRLWKYACIIAAAGMCTVFISWRFAAGYLLGCAVCMLNYKRNESFWTGILNIGTAKKGTGFLHFLLNYALMAGSMLLAAFFPQYLNLFGVAAGLMLIKLATIADAVLHH